MTTTNDQDSCPICCEKYTPKLRKPVECFACNNKSCSPCVRAYLLNCTEDPHCMHCKVAWSRQFIDEHICRSFMLKEYKEHRENILCEREKSKLPATQALMSTVQDRQSLLYADVEELQEQRNDLEAEFKRLRTEYELRLLNLDRAVHQRTSQFSQLEQVLSGYTDNLPNDSTFKEEVSSTAKNFVHPCPKPDCKGMLSSKYKCGICSTYVCKDCHCIIEKMNDPNHTCKEDDVATVKQIKKETRACPSCAVPIFKIDGCDQMWCTQCHKAFSWKTGQFVTRGQIHNPHFYEWKRNNGGLAAGAVDANGCPVALPELSDLRATFLTLTGKAMPGIFYDIHREVGHIRAIELNEPRAWADPTRRLRIQYMTKKITEKEWKSTLQKMEKQDNIRRESSQLFDMYVDASRDIFLKILNCQTCMELLDCLKEFLSLGNYVRDSIQKLTARYNTQKYYRYVTWVYADLPKCISQLNNLMQYSIGSTST